MTLPNREGPSAGTWVVAPSERCGGDLLRLSVGDHCVQVACGTVPLADVPEAWGTAFCLPAARADATLRLLDPVDPTWLAGARANVSTAARWWGGSAELRIEHPEPATRSGWQRRSRPPGADTPAPGRALCFTGGVDSFFSLLRGAHRPSHLMFVVGFDVDLDDEPRTAEVTAMVAAVSAGVGAEPLVVRTDLRSHPQFSSVSWEHTHGAALAGIGHLLHQTISTMVIPPSYATSRLVPWGSRPDLDPRWSVPGRLHIEHGDASGRRVDRLLAIADHPLVHRHLRVCWQNEGGTPNCGRCEKCVRTMVMLAGADQLQHCETFPDRATLPAVLGDLAPIGAGQAVMWHDLVELPLRSDERRALEALLDRSA